MKSCHCVHQGCPCGYFTDPKKECRCHSHQIQKYLSRISGPLLDRIDLHLEVAGLRPEELLSSPKGEASQDIKKRTGRARVLQQERFKNTSIFSNAQMGTKEIRAFCLLSSDGQGLLKKAIEELGFSARAHDKVLKVARTIADLEGQDVIAAEHLAEAIQYRSLDRNWWG